MKTRWLVAGLTAVLITGGGATVAQRIITQKTRGVLPDKDDAAHPDSRTAPALQPDPAVQATFSEVRPAGAANPGLPVDPPREKVGSTLPEPGLSLPGDPAPAEAPAAQAVIPTVAVDAVPPPPEVAATVEPTTPAADPAPADPAINPAMASSPADGTGGAKDPAAPKELLAKADPVDSVEAFVERNRKEAETAISTLTTEAENLKARLAKVEVALARWQTFSRALNADQPASQSTITVTNRPGWKRNTPEHPAESTVTTTVEGHVEPSPDLAPVDHPPETPASPPVSLPTEPSEPFAPEPKPATPTPAEPPGLPAEPK